MLTKEKDEQLCIEIFLKKVLPLVFVDLAILVGFFKFVTYFFRSFFFLEVYGWISLMEPCMKSN